MKIGHVHLKVGDLRAMEAFYRAAFGLETRDTQGERGVDRWDSVDQTLAPERLLVLLETAW